MRRRLLHQTSASIFFGGGGEVYKKNAGQCQGIAQENCPSIKGREVTHQDLGRGEGQRGREVNAADMKPHENKRKRYFWVGTMLPQNRPPSNSKEGEGESQPPDLRRGEVRSGGKVRNAPGTFESSIHPHWHPQLTYVGNMVVYP